jgi:ribonuclease D
MTPSPPRWVRSPEELADLAGVLARAGTVAVDTESDSFFHYYEKVCLLQFAVPAGDSWLVDPLAVKDLSGLTALMADRGVEKLFHGGENDIGLLKRDFGWSFARTYDTQAAARLCGRAELGLQSLLEKEFGIRLSKVHQRTDWSRRPLDPGQEAYAAEDVRHLFRLKERLREQLASMGRESWGLEEGEGLADTPPAAVRVAADFMAAKGARDLGPKGLFALRELFHLREGWAKRADLPLFKIVNDEALVTLAARRPSTIDGLRGVRGLGPRLVDRRGHEILAALRRADSPSVEPLPKKVHAPRLRRSPASCQLMDRLKAWRQEAGPRVGLESGVVLPQRLIDAIADAMPADLEALGRVPGLRRWRVEAFGAELEKLLR